MISFHIISRVSLNNKNTHSPVRKRSVDVSFHFTFFLLCKPAIMFLLDCVIKLQALCFFLSAHFCSSLLYLIGNKSSINKKQTNIRIDHPSLALYTHFHKNALVHPQYIISVITNNVYLTILYFSCNV